MTVKKSIADLVTALRSGEFVKGRGRLRAFNTDTQEHSYCCEGVMCMISEIPILDESEDDVYNHILVTNFQADSSLFRTRTAAFAPSSVWEGTGVQTQQGGEVLMIELPEYCIQDSAFVGGKTKFDLEFEDWGSTSFASLNDFQSYDVNNFTFDQIADLLEWAYVRSYGNA
jgi:hypothetical protein